MGISIPQLLIILLIVALLFGTKKLRGIGSDLGSALKGFKNAMSEDDKNDKDAEETGQEEDSANNVIEGEVHQSEQTSKQKEEKV